MLRLCSKGDDGIFRSAAFSDEVGPGYFYRYLLDRIWDPSLRRIVWIMLNPSTASHLADDATIRRVISFTKALGGGSAVVANMYAWISKTPADLHTVPDPVGPDNLESVIELLGSGDMVVAAWGVLKPPLPKTVPAIISGMRRICPKIACLGTTKDGHPKHPLYLSGETKLVPWNPEEVPV